MQRYYFDTYAFVEILMDNPNYISYESKATIYTNKLNLMELGYSILKDGANEDKIRNIFEELLKHTVEFPDSVYLEAIKLKHKHYKRKMSYVDCLGYCMALHLGIKFLTGDEKFKDLTNVEFVK